MNSRARRTLLRLFAILLATTLIAAACGDDDGDSGDDASVGDDTDDTGDDGDTGNDGDDTGDDGDDTGDDGDTGDGGDDAEDPEPDEPEEERTASWRGVTADTITVGIAMLDFDLLKELNLSQAGWGDQQAVWEALIADLNANGGINGRTLEAVYDFYSPIDATDADRSCTTLTLDQDVFANLGGFVGPLAGTADPCIVGLNNTFLVGGEQTAAELAQATAPWFHPAASDEDNTGLLLDLLLDTGRADGTEKVYTVGGAAAEGQQPIVIDALESRGFEVVGSSIVEATDGDTFAQDTELEVIMAKVQDEEADVIFIHGTPSSTIRGAANAGLIGEIALWANDSAGLANLGNTIEDKSVADGVLTATGPTDTEIYEDPAYQTQCNDVVAAAIPDADLRPPTEYAADEENWFNPIRRYCQHLSLFVQIVEAAGINPTYDSIVEAANSLTDFSLPGLPNASLGPGKFTAAATARLSAYDSTEGDGMPVPITDLQ